LQKFLPQKSINVSESVCFGFSHAKNLVEEDKFFH